jgi:hypothetical protein
MRECPACDPNAASAEPALVGDVEAPARASKMEAAAPTPQVEAPARASKVHLPAPIQWASRPIPNGEGTSPIPELSSHALDPVLPQLLPLTGGDSHADNPFQQSAAMLDDPAPAEPPPQERISVALPAVPASLRAFIAELRPPMDAVPARPSTPVQRKPDPEPPRVNSRIAIPLTGMRRAEAVPQGEVAALPIPASRPARPGTPSLALAPDVAPWIRYSPLAGRPLRPMDAEKKILKTGCVPRTSLPGPMLTTRLVKFQDRELNPILPKALLVKKRLIPGWMMTALIIGTVLGAGFSSVFSFVSRSGTETKAPAAAVVEPAAPTPAAEPSSTSLAKALEVTGFRIRLNPEKSEIEYLVVNHTPSRFSGVTVYVTLYPVNAKAGQPPLCRFNFAPNLGPYQSKEMTASIQPVGRVTVPDWQDLHADVEIGQ